MFKTVTQQAKLTPRKAPYFYRLGTGQHLGVRKTEGGLFWLAKAYDADTRKETIKSLGDYSGLPAHERFDAAARAAREWFDHLKLGGRTEQVTLAEACDRYVKHLRKGRRKSTADDAAARFKRYVLSDAIAKVQLAKLTAAQVRQWRQRLAEEPAKQPKRGPRCRVKTEQPPAQRRSDATINRDMTTLRAALNLAKRDGFVITDQAWLVELAPIKGATRRRDLYLTRDQRRELIKALADDAAAFVRGLSVLPLRPGALAALTVADFDTRLGALRIGTDKAGAGRVIHLPEKTANLLRELAKDKLPGAPLFARWDGKGWDRHSWKGPIKDAAASAGLPAATTAYTLRHSGITDLVTAGLDLFTVAALSGTSVAMIEKHYGHLQQDRAREALAGLVL